MVQPAAWFPGGTHLLATWVEDPRKTSGMWQVTVVGGETRKLLKDGHSPSISPDGLQIAFLTGPETSEELWIAQADGQRPRQLLALSGSFVGQIAWAPRSGRIAYTMARYRHDDYSDTQIETMNLADGKRNVVLSQAGLDPGLAWTPDGRLLFGVHEPSPSQDDSNVWSIRIDEASGNTLGPRERLTSTPGYLGDMTLSSNGRRLAVAKYALQSDVYVADLKRFSPFSLMRTA